MMMIQGSIGGISSGFLSVPTESQSPKQWRVSCCRDRESLNSVSPGACFTHHKDPLCSHAACFYPTWQNTSIRPPQLHPGWTPDITLSETKKTQRSPQGLGMPSRCSEGMTIWVVNLEIFSLPPAEVTKGPSHPIFEETPRSWWEQPPFPFKSRGNACSGPLPTEQVCWLCRIVVHAAPTGLPGEFQTLDVRGLTLKC